MISYRCVSKGKIVILKKAGKCFKDKKLLSIILPTYNEEGNIGKLVAELNKTLNSSGYKGKFEIVIVDDNSKDKTGEIIDKLSGKDNVLAVHREGIRGIFSAIQDGIKICNGKWILTMDADLSHPPELIPKLLEYKDEYDIVSGSRFAKGGGMEAPFTRKFGSWIINKACAVIMGIKLSDIAGGFHLIRKDKFEKIKFQLISKFGEFDFELLYRASKLGFKIKEIPFVYRFRKSGDSKMGSGSAIFSLLKNAFNYFKRAFQLRFET